MAKPITHGSVLMVFLPLFALRCAVPLGQRAAGMHAATNTIRKEISSRKNQGLLDWLCHSGGRASYCHFPKKTPQRRVTCLTRTTTKRCRGQSKKNLTKLSKEKFDAKDLLAIDRANDDSSRFSFRETRSSFSRICLTFEHASSPAGDDDA